MIFHRKTKQFNVVVMSFINSPAHAQRQTNRMLTKCKEYVRLFIDDIIVFFKTLEDHIQHLNEVLKIISKHRITMSSKKAYLDYSSFVMLRQIVDDLSLITTDEKIKVIKNLIF